VTDRTPDAFARVAAIGASLPGVEVGTSYGTSALRVRKTGLCRMREDAETLVVPAADLEEKEYLLATEPDVFYETPHYEGYRYVLVRLARIDDARLRALLEAAWRRAASKAAIAAYDAKRSPAP
jgi:hypothetical protein